MLFDKLRQIEERSNEIARALSDPAILARPTEYARLRKEHAETVEIVDRFTEYREVLKRLGEARHLLSEGGDRELMDLAQAEVNDLTARQTALEDELKRLLLPRDPNDAKNVFVEIRAGAGGEEAALFAADLARMYTKYAERQRWKIEVMDVSTTGTGGVKEVILFIQGRGAWSRLKFERGHGGERADPHLDRHRRRTARGGGRRRQDRREGPQGRCVPLLRAGRAGREHDRLGGARHAPADRARRHVPGRALAAEEPGEGDARAQGPAPRARAAGAAGGDRRRPQEPGGNRRAERTDPNLQLSPRRASPTTGSA